MSHSSLLLQRTVILNGQNYWIRRCYKCTAVDSFYNRSKWNLGGECVSMIDERRSIIPIPTIQFHTAAPSKKHLMTYYTCNDDIYTVFVPQVHFCNILKMIDQIWNCIYYKKWPSLALVPTRYQLAGANLSPTM